MAVQFFQVMCNATHIVHHAISSRCLHARHASWRHNRCLHTQCTQLGPLVTLHRAWFSSHGTNRSACGTQRQSCSWNMMFHFKSELSSVSILPAVFLHLKCFVCSPKYFMRLMRVRDLRTYGHGTLPLTKVIDLRKPNLLTCRQHSRNPRSGGYCAAFLLSVCLRPS